MSSPAVWITGVGLLTPLGDSAWATMRALLDGRTITDRLDCIAEPLDAEQIIRGAGRITRGRNGHGDPAAALALRALHEAAGKAGLRPADVAATPIIVASSKGAVSSLLDPAQGGIGAALGPHGRLCALIASQMGAPCCRTVVAACASGLVALDHAVRMLRRGEAERVAVVAVEASLIPLLMHSYRRLGVLPPLTAQGYRCRPLDRRRCGFTLTDQAAAVILDARGPLTSPRSAATGAAVRLLGVRAFCEAHHLIRSPPNSVALANLSRWACREMGRIDILHPHATGTVENDEAEMVIHSQALGERAEATHAFALKGAVGHGLGSAGLASVVIAAMIARCSRVPPMPWLNDPIATPLRLSPEGARGSFRRHAIFARGFGGHVAAAVIESD